MTDHDYRLEPNVSFTPDQYAPNGLPGSARNASATMAAVSIAPASDVWVCLSGNIA